MVDQQIEELRRHLSSCDSTLAWIQVYNAFVVRYMTSMFGKAGNAFGRVHVDSALSTLERVHRSLFANGKPHLRLKGGSAEGYLKSALQELFKVNDIPNGYLYFPTSLGGLDLWNPFIPLVQAQNEVLKHPAQIMDTFFTVEETKCDQVKDVFLAGRVVRPKDLTYVSDNSDTFMAFEEYTAHREQTSEELLKVFNRLLRQPEKKPYPMAKNIATHVKYEDWDDLTSYQQWIVHIYGIDMIERFGGLQIVDQDLLPVGMVDAIRSKRVRW